MTAPINGSQARNLYTVTLQDGRSAEVYASDGGDAGMTVQDHFDVCSSDVAHVAEIQTVRVSEIQTVLRAHGCETAADECHSRELVLAEIMELARAFSRDETPIAGMTFADLVAAREHHQQEADHCRRLIVVRRRAELIAKQAREIQGAPHDMAALEAIRDQAEPQHPTGTWARDVARDANAKGEGVGS